MGMLSVLPFVRQVHRIFSFLIEIWHQLGGMTSMQLPLNSRSATRITAMDFDTCIVFNLAM